MLRYVLGKKFEGNGTAKFQILSPVHHSHSASSQDFQNAIMRNALAGNSRICRKRRAGVGVFSLLEGSLPLLPFEGKDEPIASAREGLNILWALSTVADGLA